MLCVIDTYVCAVCVCSVCVIDGFFVGAVECECVINASHPLNTKLVIMCCFV